ncbi:MAG: alpha-mannosidase [Candidatus Methanospirareceae archaeon]
MAKKKKKEERDTIYLVPHTHYDAIWAFTKEDYFYINMLLILKEVAELIEKTNYRFLVEQTYLLEEVEHRYPELFALLTEQIKAGKLEVADGEYLMADTMLPAGETLIREIQVGKQYVKEKFGVDVPVMWQADSFGLNAQLPQIYTKCGYKYVAFRRGIAENKPSEFLWEGLDGTKILAHWMPLGYRAGLDLTKLNESYKKLKALAATSHILMPSGSGVTMPQPETPAVVEDWNRERGKEALMKVATPREFFEALEQEAKDLELAVRTGEMYSGRYSEIFPDVSSTRMWIKEGLADFENWLTCVERWGTITWLLNSYYPSDELRESWRKILFIAFHDVIPGTGMDRGYDEVKQYLSFLKTYMAALCPRIFAELVDEESKLGEFTRFIEGGVESESGDIIVFNSLSWGVKNWLEMDLNFQRGQVVSVGGLKCGTEEIEVEVIRFTRYTDDSLKYVRIGFVATVPALGYKVYRIIERDPRRLPFDPDFIRIHGNTIENRFFGVEVDPATGLINVMHKRERTRKTACRANELVLEEETGDLYYHRQKLCIPLKTETGEGVKYGSFRLKNFSIDKSPLRRVIKVDTDYYSLRWPYRLTEKMEPRIWRHRFLECSKKIVVYKGLSRIDFLTTVVDKHPRARLRVRFSTNIKSDSYVCGTQFGSITRPRSDIRCDQRDEFESWVEVPRGVFPSQQWVDYSDDVWGLTVIHHGIPENEVRDGSIYLTLLRSVSMLSSDGKTGPAIPVPEARELKRYTFRYAIHPHEGDWRTATSYRRAQEFNVDLDAMQLSRDVKLPNRRSFLEIAPSSVMLTALKRSEDKEGVMLRFYEANGEETKTEIRLFKAPTEVKVVNMLEEEDQALTKEVIQEGATLKLTMNPFEIVTLRLEF